MLNPADVELLVGLFGEGGAFRHRMGVRPLAGRVFYAPTGQAAEIQAEKSGILNGSDGELYLLNTPAGGAAFEEFTTLHSPGARPDGGDDDPVTTTRAMALRIEPDFLLLSPPDWRLVWAAVCFPTRWSLEGRAQRPLAEIHGVVPGLNEELGRKINVFFDRLPPRADGEGWGRANWGLATSAQRNQHPRRPLVGLTPELPPGQVFLRVEAQHFSKLPVTGAVVFGIRILHYALSEVLDHANDAIGQGLREQLRSMPPAVADYKGIPSAWWQRWL